jgi:3-methyladenine DNA glycosylase AlkD
MRTTGKDAARAAIDAIRRLPIRNVPAMRAVRRRLSAALRGARPDEVNAAAEALLAAGLVWFAFEVIHHHEAALARLTAADLERLGAGMVSWGEVDAFGTYLAGPAWLCGQIRDSVVRRWARSDNVWWRRTALVATTVLNTRSRGGRGDAARTLDIAEMLAADRDDMVVKALSWALRTLVPWDPAAVERFLADHDAELAARVKREVRTKLRTGLKTARKRGPRA